MSKFVKMQKDGQTIEVSPLVVENHKSLGWKVVGEAEEAAAPAESTAEKPPKGEPKRRQRSKKNKADQPPAEE